MTRRWITVLALSSLTLIAVAFTAGAIVALFWIAGAI